MSDVGLALAEAEAAEAGERVRLPRGKLRGAIWATVRDAGRSGMARHAVASLVQVWCSESTCDKWLAALRHGGYLLYEGRRYYVDENCRVPAGEQPHLGPGWELSTRVADLEGSGPLPPEEMCRIRLTDFEKSELLKLAEAPGEIVRFEPPASVPAPDEARPGGLYARFDSNGILELKTPQGALTLMPEDTRRLFNFLDLMQGGGA
jgi:hypothetical protein